MEPHKIVSQEEWLAARKAHLLKEKELTRLRDQLSAERRALPWVEVEKRYVQGGESNGWTIPDASWEVHLGGSSRDLRVTDIQMLTKAGRSQLIIYHFMLGPGWKQGCKSCSFLADHIDGARVHLAHRDVTLAVVSRARRDRV